MQCKRCSHRLRPLKKRNKLGLIAKTLPGVAYCPECKLTFLTDAELAMRARAQEFSERVLERLTKLKALDPEDDPDPPKAA